MNNPAFPPYRAVLMFLALFGFGAGAAAQNRVAFVNLSGQLVTVAPDGGAERVLTPPGRRYQFPAWSPTENELAAIGADAAGGGVFTVADADGAEAEALYQDPSAGPIYLYWSPDGEKVGFLASGAGGLGLEVATLANAELTEVTSGSPVYWQWTRDSERLFVHTGLGENGEVAFYSEAGRSGDRLADPGFFNAPGLSPSERYLAYAELTAAGARVILQGNAPGTAEVRREVRYEGAAVLTWSPAADQLAIMSPPAALSVPYGPIRLLDAATGDLTPLVDRSAVAFFWSPDGERIELFDDEMAAQVRQMLVEGVEAEAQFADDLLGGGVAGLSSTDMRSYLEHVADRRMERLGLDPIYGTPNPLAFMELQDVQELSNFFERKVSAYQVGVTGNVGFDEDF